MLESSPRIASACLALSRRALATRQRIGIMPKMEDV
jgi:hypothetical protein